MALSMMAAVLTAVKAPLGVVSVPRPVPGASEVLVRVAAAGTNPLDLKIIAGEAAHARQQPPAILGLDMAGIVEAVGPGVTRFRPGDAVYGMVGGVGGVPGTLADYVAADADLLAAKPANLDLREAAVLPLVTITAWEGLVDRIGIKAGQTLLVLGGAGGVGQIVIQLGLASGARVSATGSAASRTAIEALGATFIDRSTPTGELVSQFTDGRGFEAVYDTVGALDVAFAALGRFGRVASALGWGTQALAPLSFKGGTYSGVFTLMPLISGEGRARHGQILEEARRLVETGRLAPRLDPRHFALDDVNAAYAALQAGDGAGKIAVDIGMD